MAQYTPPLNYATIFNAADFNPTRQTSPDNHWGTPGVKASQTLANASIEIGAISGSVNSLANGVYLLSMTATNNVSPAVTSVSGSCLLESSSSATSGGLTLQTNSASVVGNVYGTGLPAGTTLPASTIGIVFNGGWTSCNITSNTATVYDVTWSLVRFA